MSALLLGIGRKVWAYAALAAAAGLFLLNVYLRGKDAQRAVQDRQSLDNLRERNRIDDKAGTMDRDRIRDELSRWVRDDG